MLRMAAMLRGALLAATACAALGGWAVQWQEDFDGPAGSTPNPDTWNARSQGGFVNNHEAEYNTPDNCYLDGEGRLVLKSVPNTTFASLGYNFTSCYMDTARKFNVTYGRIEFHAKLPDGPGMWPAHWLMPDYDGAACWPRAGEIDVMERIDSLRSVHGALHWANASINGCGGAVELNGGNWSSALPFDPAADYHSYGIVWTAVDGPAGAGVADSISYYVDDWQSPYTAVFNVSAKFPQQPFHLIVNSAVGGAGSWPGPTNSSDTWPQYHLIDRVTVFQWQD